MKRPHAGAAGRPPWLPCCGGDSAAEFPPQTRRPGYGPEAAARCLHPPSGVLPILTRQALFGSCSLLSNISLFAPHSSCNGKSARATLLKLRWSGMSALLRPCAKRTLERCPAAPVDLSFQPAWYTPRPESPREFL